METGLTKAQVISQLTRSPHRDLMTYVPVGRQAALEDPEFFAHLIAWNHHRGEIRDAKAALPVLQLRAEQPALVENALAHLADLNPRLLVKALDFCKQIDGPKNLVYRFVKRYLRDMELDWSEWENAAVQHPVSMPRLYARYRVPRDERVMAAFHWKDRATGVRLPRQGKAAIINALSTMTATQISGTMEQHKLPWIVVRGALGKRVQEPDILMAIIGRMTAADLATNAKWLIKAGVKDHPQTRAAFEASLVKAAKPRRARGTTLKAGKKAKELADIGEAKIAGKLQELQEKQLEHLRTIEGNWLIVGDKSSSMAHTIAMARRIASVLARLVKGDVHLVFTDESPRSYGNVSGQTLEQIEALTEMVMAKGATSLGCGLKYALERKVALDGIAIVSDGAENTPPFFGDEFARYVKLMDRTPTVYWYRTKPDGHMLTPSWIRDFIDRGKKQADITEIDLRAGVDDYSLPNVVATMKAGKYQLLDDIMATKLRRLDEVLTRTHGMEVLAHVGPVGETATL